MDLFRFLHPEKDGLDRFVGGEIINGYDRLMWIERYADAGEFSIEAKVSSGLREALPVGSYISHVTTQEIMRVEDHQIQDKEDGPAVIKITGRSLETILEGKVVGSNLDYSDTPAPAEYTLWASYVWFQIVDLVEKHLYSENLLNQSDSVDSIRIMNTVWKTLPTDVIETRKIKPGNLYEELLKLLKVSNLGIRIWRPGFFGWTVDMSKAVFIIHRGNDVSNYVTFSYRAGEVLSADYLWSDRKKKNCAMVQNNYFSVMVDDIGASGLDRRMMYVNATDIVNESGPSDTPPWGWEKEQMLARMVARGRQELAKQNDLALVKAEVARENLTFEYRNHYEVGDIVKVIGEYGESAPMRVTEYVEIEDENGESGYPTLSAITEE